MIHILIITLVDSKCEFGCFFTYDSHLSIKYYLTVVLKGLREIGVLLFVMISVKLAWVFAIVSSVLGFNYLLVAESALFVFYVITDKLINLLITFRVNKTMTEQIKTAKRKTGENLLDKIRQITVFDK